MAELFSRDEAEALARRILGLVSADGGQVWLESERYGHTRYAVNRITTAGDTRDRRATVTVRRGRRSASATFNQFDDATLARGVETAERLAALAPEDPEQPPLVPPQTYLEVAAAFPATEALEAGARADAALAVIEHAAARGLVATGFLERRVGAVAVANTAGLFAYHRHTAASHTTTVRTADGRGSGWAGTTHNDWDRMTPPAELAAHAAEKAARSVEVGSLDPGAYTVLLEPTAVGNLVQLLGGHLDHRAAVEGRSFFSAQGGTKVGRRVVAPVVSLRSDPTRPDVLARPFAADGLPFGRTDWIADGVLRHLAVSREWAARANLDPRPYPGFLELPGTDTADGALLAGIERGVLVTRFWYIRGTDPRTVSYTGLTRDGTFLIENGAITRAVHNFRFNESVVGVLDRVEAMGRARRVVASESGGIGAPIVVPPLVVREFQFTSVSDAV